MGKAKSPVQILELYNGIEDSNNGQTKSVKPALLHLAVSKMIDLSTRKSYARHNIKEKIDSLQLTQPQSFALHDRLSRRKVLGFPVATRRRLLQRLLRSSSCAHEYEESELEPARA